MKLAGMAKLIALIKEKTLVTFNADWKLHWVPTVTHPAKGEMWLVVARANQLKLATL